VKLGGASVSRGAAGIEVVRYKGCFWLPILFQVKIEWIHSTCANYLIFTAPYLLFNIVSDYLSLFVIRPLLIRSGTKPVIGLVVGAVSGVAIVLAFNALRYVLMIVWENWIAPDIAIRRELLHYVVPSGLFAAAFAWPAMAVFAWLPLFALGILIARLLTPLSWIVGRTQGFLKEGKEHPLKAIGCVAAVVVFVGTVVGRTVFSAL
jgi:hypothetical protein